MKLCITAMPFKKHYLQYFIFHFTTERDVIGKNLIAFSESALSNYLLSIFAWNSAKLMQTCVVVIVFTSLFFSNLPIVES